MKPTSRWNYANALEIMNRVDDGPFLEVVNQLQVIISLHYMLRERIQMDVINNATSIMNSVILNLQSLMHMAGDDLQADWTSFIDVYQACYSQDEENMIGGLIDRLTDCSKTFSTVKDSLQNDQRVPTAGYLKKSIYSIVSLQLQLDNTDIFFGQSIVNSGCPSDPTSALCSSVVQVGNLNLLLSKISTEFECLESNGSLCYGIGHENFLTGCISDLVLANEVMSNLSTCLSLYSTFIQSSANLQQGINFDASPVSAEVELKGALNVLQIDAALLQSLLDQYQTFNMTKVELAQVFLGSPMVTVLANINSALSTVNQFAVTGLQTFITDQDVILKQAYTELVNYLIQFQASQCNV